MKKKENATTTAMSAMLEAPIDTGNITSAQQRINTYSSDLTLHELMRKAGLKSTEDFRCRGSQEIREACRISTFMEAHDLKFDGARGIRLKTLTLSGDYCSLIYLLRFTVGEQGYYDEKQKRFTWHPSKPYQSNRFAFVIDEDTMLDYDANGMLRSPFTSIPMPTYEWDGWLEANYTKWKFYLVEKNAVRFATDYNYCLYPANSLAGAWVFCVAEWGGPNSDTRGLSKEEVSKNRSVMSFEKVRSRAGKNGTDYFLLYLPDEPSFLDALTKVIDKMKYELLNEEDEFARKFSLFNHYKGSLPSIQEQYTEAKRQAEALGQECLANPIAREYFVDIPDLTITPPEELDNASLNMSIEDLTNAINLALDTKAVDRKLAETQRIARNWTEFAPKFVKLHSALQNVNVELHVGGKSATLTYANTSTLSLTSTDEVLYDAWQFREFLTWLDDRVNNYTKVHQLITETSAQLLKTLEDG